MEGFDFICFSFGAVKPEHFSSFNVPYCPQILGTQWKHAVEVTRGGLNLGNSVLGLDLFVRVNICRYFLSLQCSKFDVGVRARPKEIMGLFSRSPMELLYNFC